MNFGIKLQLLRKEKRMSQEALAQQLDVSRQAVSKWETGDGYPEMDKLITISNLFGVTLDYLMKDGKDSDSDNVATISDDAIVLSTPELEDFISFKQKFGCIIGLCVAAIICSATLSIFFKDSNLAAGAMMLIIAVAVGVLIVTGILSQKYEYLDKKHIHLKSADLEKMKEKQKKHKTNFAISIAIGVFLIIAALAAVAVFEEERPEMSAYLLIVVAFSVFLFITAGIKDGMYRQICDNKEFVKEVIKEEEGGKYYGVTMPLAAMVYLLLGFLFNAWHPGWIVFPITAIATNAFIAIKK